MTEQTPEETKREKILQQSYAKASTVLRKRHKEEFNSLRKEFANAAGVEWDPKMTAEQRAEQEFRSLLIQYPMLAKLMEP